MFFEEICVTHWYLPRASILLHTCIIYNVYGNHKVYIRNEECQNFSLWVAYEGVILNPLC